MRPASTTAATIYCPFAGFWKEHTTPDGSRYYHNEVRNVSKWTLSDEEKARMSAPINPYDNELVMPLREFVRHPIAQVILGACNGWQQLHAVHMLIDMSIIVCQHCAGMYM